MFDVKSIDKIKATKVPTKVSRGVFGGLCVNMGEGVLDAAYLVYGRMRTVGVALDASIILLVIEILQYVASACDLWGEDEEDEDTEIARATVLKTRAAQTGVRGALIHVLLRRQIRRCLKRDDDGYTKAEKEMFRKCGNDIANAILEAGENATPETIRTAMTNIVNAAKTV